MRGHIAPNWDMDPQRLLIWLLRVVLQGRSECPALAGPLAEALGEHSTEAVAAAQLLALGLARGGALLPAEPSFDQGFAAHEQAVLGALGAAERRERAACLRILTPWTGCYAATAATAAFSLARVFSEAGLSFCAPPNIAAE